MVWNVGVVMFTSGNWWVFYPIVAGTGGSVSIPTNHGLGHHYVYEFRYSECGEIILNYDKCAPKTGRVQIP